ncbi:MAG: glutamate 5-kinase [Hyphomicrobiales bacterium]
MSARLTNARRVIVKIGSALLVDQATGRLRRAWLEALADDIARLRQRGQDVVIVSSGAIALGRRLIGHGDGTLKLEESQAAAAVGQVALAQAYAQALADRGFVGAQVLLTLTDTEQRRRYLNARNTIAALLRHGAVPVINENDTVATSEIRYGDNDRLAARVASMISADCLVLLSDVDGFYTAAPDADPSARLIPEVTRITPEIEAMAGKSRTNVGSGGMITKLEAAKIAVGAGAHMAITSGHADHPLTALENGANCTWFMADATPVAARKKWIAGTLEPCGTLTVDDGAATALRSGKSLLPAGIVEVSGRFGRGDAVRVVDRQGTELGRGLSAYDRADAERIAGHKSREIERVLGYRGRDEVIHRDDLVLVKG